MYTPIRRSAYPDTRDEQAMRRFMAGTLNVGHHLTFQRKGNVVNVFPQADEKEKLVKIFDSLKIHKKDRCVNARLILHEAPLPPEKQLSRDLEFQVHPYNLAEITLTPAERLSETGKRRNMHMQTHKDLPNIHPVHVFGLGQRKGQLTLLQFVKDSYNFKRDLLLDEQEDAARNSRAFVLSRSLNPTEQLTSLPADPNRHFCDLFESQSQQATTPSEVGFNAHQAAMQYFHGNSQADMANTRPSNANVPARRELDVFGSSASADSQRFYPSTLVSRFQPPVHSKQSGTEAASSQTAPTQQVMMNVQTTSVEQIEDAGRAAAQKIYHAPTVNPNAKRPIPQLPNVKDFLDVERWRFILQQRETQPYDMFSAWQNSQKSACQPSWVGRARLNLAGPSVHENTGMDDSGIATNQDPTKQTGEPSYQGNTSSDKAEGNLPDVDEPVHQSTSAQRPILSTQNTTSHPLEHHQKDQERHEEHEDAPTPTMSAASTLLSLSPAKVMEAGQPNTH